MIHYQVIELLFHKVFMFLQVTRFPVSITIQQVILALVTVYHQKWIILGVQPSGKNSNLYQFSIHFSICSMLVFKPTGFSLMREAVLDNAIVLPYLFQNNLSLKSLIYIVKIIHIWVFVHNQTCLYQSWTMDWN